MRLYAFLLVAGAAICVRAASIPVAETEKKLMDNIPDNLDKLPEQELIDQANTSKDVDNKLRTKPEDIPVEVIVENAQPALKADEQDEEIIRPVPDLRNPGPPQRQEHETQNPEYYSSEQQTIALFKQSINNARNVLIQGFQGITDGIQHIIATNEPIQSLQKNIQSLRDSFTAEMVKVNATIQSYLSSESVAVDKPAAEETKAGFHQIEQGLFKLRNEFNKGVSTLADGVEVVALLKADSEAQTDSSSASSASPSPAPAPAASAMNITALMQSIANNMQNALSNMSETLNKVSQSWNPFGQNIGQNSGSASNATVPAEAQSDAQVTSAPPATNNPLFQGFHQFSTNIQNFTGQFLGTIFQPQGSGGFVQNFNNFLNGILPINRPAGQAPQGTQPAQTGSKPEETATKPETKPEIKPEPQSEPAKPAAGAETAPQAAAVTPVGPIRQILQNNPITQSIAGAVQRLQNINNPEKPRDGQPAEQIKNLDEEKADTESKKGGGPNTGE